MSLGVVPVGGGLGGGVVAAESWVVWTGEELRAEVVSLSLGDGLAADVLGSVETADLLSLLEKGLVVAVAAGNDDVEVLTVLAGVGGGLAGDAGSPESTLVVGDGWWVGARWAWVHGWVTLNVDVEGAAELVVVAVHGALVHIVVVEDVVGKIGVLLSGAVKIAKFLDVRKRRRLAVRKSAPERVVLEADISVWVGTRGSACWLRSASAITLAWGLWGRGGLHTVGDGGTLRLSVVWLVRLSRGSNWGSSRCWKRGGVDDANVELLGSGNASKGSQGNEGVLHVGRRSRDSE